MSREIFEDIITPFVFSPGDRALAADITDGIRSGEVALGELEQEKLGKINEVLKHPELDELIEEGKITLGLIKPQANASKGLSSDDQEAADVLIDEIGAGNIIFSFSTKLSGRDVEQFYQDAKKNFTKNYPNLKEGQRIWKSIYDHAQSGPLTFILLYHEQGNAVEWWRGKMGATHPNQAEEESIRGKYAIEANLPNNLVHGSDSIESVKKEVDELRRLIRELLEQSAATKKSMLIYSEKGPRKILGVERGWEIVAIQRIFEKRGLLQVSSLKAISYNPRDLDIKPLNFQPDSLSA